MPEGTAWLALAPTILIPFGLALAMAAAFRLADHAQTEGAHGGMILRTTAIMTAAASASGLGLGAGYTILKYGRGQAAAIAATATGAIVAAAILIWLAGAVDAAAAAQAERRKGRGARTPIKRRIEPFPPARGGGKERGSQGKYMPPERESPTASLPRPFRRADLAKGKKIA